MPGYPARHRLKPHLPRTPGRLFPNPMPDKLRSDKHLVGARADDGKLAAHGPYSSLLTIPSLAAAVLSHPADAVYPRQCRRVPGPGQRYLGHPIPALDGSDLHQQTATLDLPSGKLVQSAQASLDSALASTRDSLSDLQVSALAWSIRRSDTPTQSVPQYDLSAPWSASPMAIP